MSGALRSARQGGGPAITVDRVTHDPCGRAGRPLDVSRDPSQSLGPMLAAPSRITATKMLGPVATMSDYRPIRHPALADLDRRARLVIAGLQRVARMDEDHKVEGGGEWDISGDEGATEAVLEMWQINLDHLRKTQMELENGLATRRFVRDVRAHVKHLAPQLEQALADALATIRELRAEAAVFCGEHDDEELGIAVIPSPRDDAPRGPSVDIKW
ncbi:MAG: hypothetical protein U0234_09430 [Sandaracinus sp.]